MALGAGLGILVLALVPCLHTHWIATKVCAAAGAVLTLLVLTAPVLACRGPQSHETILLDAIPPAAEGSEVIAKVEILEVHIRELPGLRPFHAARARVLQSVRGTADGQIVEIFAEPTSCGGGLYQSAVGRKGFIAGRFKQIADETFFHGRWTWGQIGKF
ncbi:hypothetical protein V1292_000627 [Bradyrhizobium sp. AZCC 1719]|uniref:hypothetical protein n=1 Tax=Bradyrhizobium sp. AZCC 1719 TaxID=3117028 RepID=UPI002FF33A5C